MEYCYDTNCRIKCGPELPYIRVHISWNFFGADAPYRRVGFAIPKWHTRVQKSGKNPPPGFLLPKCYKKRLFTPRKDCFNRLSVTFVTAGVPRPLTGCLHLKCASVIGSEKYPRCLRLAGKCVFGKFFRDFTNIWNTFRSQDRRKTTWEYTGIWMNYSLWAFKLNLSRYWASKL